MNKTNKLTSVGITKDTLEQVSYLSKVTNINKKTLLGLLIEQVYSLGANYSRLFLDFDSSVTRERLTIFFGGKNKLSFQKPEVVNENE